MSKLTNQPIPKKENFAKIRKDNVTDETIQVNSKRPRVILPDKILKSFTIQDNASIHPARNLFLFLESI